VEAQALFMLTAASDARAQDAVAGGRAPSPAPAARFARTRRVLLRAAILAVAALAFWFINTCAFPSAAANRKQSTRIQAAIKERHGAGTELAMTKIVPAEVLDPGSAVFIGTGDYSNGSWIGR